MVEILTMVGFAGIAAATAIPTMVGAMQAFQHRGAAREIYAQLQQARMFAVTENNRYHWKRVGTTTGVLHDDDNGNGIEDSGERILSFNVSAAHPGAMLGGATTITFSPNGSASSSGNITVSAAGGFSATVSVGPAGRVRIQ